SCGCAACCRRGFSVASHSALFKTGRERLLPVFTPSKNNNPKQKLPEPLPPSDTARDCRKFFMTVIHASPEGSAFLRRNTLSVFFLFLCAASSVPRHMSCNP